MIHFTSVTPLGGDSSHQDGNDLSYNEGDHTDLICSDASLQVEIDPSPPPLVPFSICKPMSSSLLSTFRSGTGQSTSLWSSSLRTGSYAQKLV